MIKKLLIIGAGGLGKMTLEIAQSLGYDCFFVDDNKSTNAKVCGANVVGKISDLEILKTAYTHFVVAIGDNKVRETIANLCIGLGMTYTSIISPLSYISKFSHLGNGCIIMPFATIQNGSDVGIGTVLCSHSEIHHDACVGNFCVVYPNSVIRTFARVGERVKCGSNVSIGNNACVENDYVVGDGSTLNSSFDHTRR